MADRSRRTLLQAAGWSTAAMAAGGFGGFGVGRVLAAASPDTPPDVLDPVEVHGADAVPVIGKLPGKQSMYMLPATAGDQHELGPLRMTRIARPQETGGGHELISFSGAEGATMPRHQHLGSHVALVVMDGTVELELDGAQWTMLRGDFANIPAHTPHRWTMRGSRAKLTLFTTGNRVGAAYAAMAAPGATVSSAGLARGAMTGDFQLAPSAVASPAAVRVTNLVLPSTTTAYVLADGGGERYGGNTFCAKSLNTNGQFLFIMTEGGAGPGIGAHFHARHTEDFYAIDGETLGWANGKAVPIRNGDFFHAPPRHLHGFRMTQPYNRFVGFLTPGIFENFFTRGQPGRNGVGGRGAGEGAAAAAGGAGGAPFGPPGGAPPGAGGPPRAGGAPGTGGPPGAGGPPGGGGVDMFRTLSNSGVGPDGYPLDVHGPTLPLPAQDATWKGSLGASAARAVLLQHAMLCAGRRPPGSGMTRELEQALRFKPRAQDFA